jgi:Eisosome component PIL1
LKAAFNYQFDAVREHCEKLALIAGYGKHLLDLIDDTPDTPGEARAAYDSYDVSKQIILDCENALSEWTLDTASVKSRLSVRKPRRLSARRIEATGDLSQQDKPLERESSLWIPASEHEKVASV